MKNPYPTLLLVALTTGMILSCKKQAKSVDGFNVKALYYVGENLLDYTEPTEVSRDRAILFHFELVDNKAGYEKVEIIRKTNEEVFTCAIYKNVPAGLNFFVLKEAPAAHTEYSFKLYDHEGNMSTRGPFVFDVVDGVNKVISSSVGETLIWNKYAVLSRANSYNSASFVSSISEMIVNSVYTDFIYTGGKLYSPSNLELLNLIPELNSSCGLKKTTFLAYTGPLDPETAYDTSSPITYEQLEALPSPSPDVQDIAVVLDGKYVFETHNGFKGIVKVVKIKNNYISIFYSIQI